MSLLSKSLSFIPQMKNALVTVGRYGGNQLFAPSKKLLQEISTRVDPGSLSRTGAAIYYLPKQLTGVEAGIYNTISRELLQAKLLGKPLQVSEKLFTRGRVHELQRTTPLNTWHQDNSGGLASFVYSRTGAYNGGGFSIGTFQKSEIEPLIGGLKGFRLKNFDAPPSKQLTIPLQNKGHTHIVFDDKSLFHRGEPLEFHKITPVKVTRNEGTKIELREGIIHIPLVERQVHRTFIKNI